jgi:hypothetical protein
MYSYYFYSCLFQYFSQISFGCVFFFFLQKKRDGNDAMTRINKECKKICLQTTVECAHP